LRGRVLVVLIAAFLFRLAFGLCSEFWLEDETQVYLLGLRYAARGEWPYFGPDIGGIRAQLPGALQSLLVGVPLRVAGVPEAPYLPLNVLSLAALVAFGWYVRRRLPTLPGWLVYGWLLSAPWTLNFSTHVVNVSYVLPAAIVFFMGVLEALPGQRAGVLSLDVAHFMTGFALLWLVQLHMSWVVLIPFLMLVLVYRAREGTVPLLRALAFTAIGGTLPGLLLVPTIWKYGLLAGGTEQTVRAEWLDPSKLLLITARFLSFASFETARFLGRSTARRTYFFSQHLWLLPLVVLPAVAGLVQPIVMVGLWARKNAGDLYWRGLKWMVLATVLLLYASYFFASNKDPQAHAFYVMAPLSLLYAFHCFRQMDGPRFRRVAAAVLVLGVAYHAGLAGVRFRERSLYKNRRVVVAALRARIPEVFGHRRPFARDAGEPPPEERTPAFEAANEQPDLHITIDGWRRGAGGSSLFDMTLQHVGSAAAYRDLRYVTEYRDASGGFVRTGEGKVYEVIQPGQTLRLPAFNEGGVDARAARAVFRVVGAEKLVPIPPGY